MENLGVGKNYGIVVHSNSFTSSNNKITKLYPRLTRGYKSIHLIHHHKDGLYK